MDLGLADKVVFITGAAGGIGAALVRAFAAEGARVAACARRPDGVGRGAAPTTNGAAPLDPDRVMWVKADVCEYDQLGMAVREVELRWGRIDVCIANAGVWPPEDVPLDSMTEERIIEVIDVNLLGAIWTAKVFLTALRQVDPREDGHGASLLFIGSTAGRFGERGHAEYAATKAALRGLVLSLKNEIVAIDPAGRVNAIDPGWTVTPMVKAELDGDREQILRATRTMPLRQLATPEDVAAAALFFASPIMARHVTGESLLVAGGMEGRILW
jgi:3-oxoacyl-[acyl-carrier protein] reductase